MAGKTNTTSDVCLKCVHVLVCRNTHHQFLTCSSGRNGSDWSHTWTSCHSYNRAQMRNVGVGCQPLLLQMPLATLLLSNIVHQYWSPVISWRLPCIQTCTWPYQGSSTGDHHQRPLVHSTWPGEGARYFVPCPKTLQMKTLYWVSHFAREKVKSLHVNCLVPIWMSSYYTKGTC